MSRVPLNASSKKVPKNTRAPASARASIWLAAHNAMPHMTGCRVIRSMPRAASGSRSRRSQPTALGFLISRPQAISISANGMAMAGA
jgi:hypothetical protein